MLHRPRGKATARASRRRAGGQALVEFALVIPMFLMLVMAVFEGARLAATHVAVGSAARDGARAGIYAATSDYEASTYGTYSTSNLDLAITNAVNASAARFTGPFIGDPKLVERKACTQGHQLCVCRRQQGLSGCASTSNLAGGFVEVTVNHAFQFLPFQFGGGTGGLAAKASIPLQGFASVRID